MSTPQKTPPGVDAIAHERDAQNGLLFVDEMLLSKHSEPRVLRDGYGPFGRVAILSEDAEKGRFSETVGAYQAVPLAGIDLE